MERDGSKFKEDEDGLPVSTSQRFNHFMFNLETLAAYAAADGWQVQEFLHMCAMAWGVANRVQIDFTAILGEDKPQ